MFVYEALEIESLLFLVLSFGECVCLGIVEPRFDLKRPEPVCAGTLHNDSSYLVL